MLKKFGLRIPEAWRDLTDYDYREQINFARADIVFEKGLAGVTGFVPRLCFTAALALGLLVWQVHPAAAGKETLTVGLGEDRSYHALLNEFENEHPNIWLERVKLPLGESGTGPSFFEHYIRSREIDLLWGVDLSTLKAMAQIGLIDEGFRTTSNWT